MYSRQHYEVQHHSHSAHGVQRFGLLTHKPNRKGSESHHQMVGLEGTQRPSGSPPWAGRPQLRLPRAPSVALGTFQTRGSRFPHVTCRQARARCLGHAQAWLVEQPCVWLDKEGMKSALGISCPVSLSDCTAAISRLAHASGPREGGMPRASSPSQVRGEHPSAAPLPRATAVRRMRALSHRSLSQAPSRGSP